MKKIASLLITLLILLLPLSLHAEKKSADFTVRNIKGKYLRLSDFKGKVVEIAFWATFCKTCRKKLRHLEKLYKKYKSKGYVVIGVSTDGPETQSKVKPIVRRYKLSFPIVVDTESTISKLFNPKRSTPYSVIIKGGKLVKKREGFQISDLDLIEKDVRKLLKK